MRKPIFICIVLTLAIVALAMALLLTRSAWEKGQTDAQITPSAPMLHNGELVPIPLTDSCSINPFATFRGDGLLLAAGDVKESNAMTIGWGTMGTLWGEPVLTVFVRDDRYTHSFMERSAYFTVMTFSDKNILGYMGSHSGRDADKARAVGLHTFYTPHGTPYYAEADTIIECKVMEAHTFCNRDFRDSVPTTLYKGTDGHFHTQYIGKVVAAYRSK